MTPYIGWYNYIYIFQCFDKNMELEVLKELGLSQNEGKVYQTLIEFGDLSAAEISAKSTVSYSRIYTVLGSLISKGLAKIIPEKTKKFSGSSPEAFLGLIEEKEKKLNDAKKQVKELKKFYEVKEKNPVLLSVGRKGFYKLIEELKETQKYGYNLKWTSEYRPDWVRNRLKYKRKGIEFKELVRYDSETKKNVDSWLKVAKTIKKIDNDGVAMSIIDDNEVMISLIKSNVTLLIRDKPFAKIMKKMFSETYKNAEEIK